MAQIDLYFSLLHLKQGQDGFKAPNLFLYICYAEYIRILFSLTICLSRKEGWMEGTK